MKTSLLLFVIGMILIVMGLTNQMKPACKDRVVVKYVSRNVYDEIFNQSPDFKDHL